MISVYQKNDLLINRTITDTNGNAIDLSGSTIFFEVGDIIEKSTGDGITITDANSGEIEIRITDDDTDIKTGDYQSELLIIDSEGNRYVGFRDTFRIKYSILKDKE